MISPGSSPDRVEDLVSLPGVAEAVAEARAMVDRLLVHRVLRTRTAQLAAESSLRGARASAALEGEDRPLDEVRTGLSTPPPTLAGALRVHAELPRLRAVWRSSPRQALARLHLLAAADLVTADRLGRPAGDEGAAAIGRIAAETARRTSAPAVVAAAVVHGELLCAAPFAGGNGLVARAAARLVLAERGLDPSLLVVPEVGHLELGDYAAALGGYGSGQPDGVAAWLRHCAGAVLAGARESLAVAEAIARG
jgi:Fic/DOC family